MSRRRTARSNRLFVARRHLGCVGRSVGRLTAAVCLAEHVAHRVGSLDRRGGRSCALWHWLREGPVSECGRLRHGDRGQGPGDRRRMALMSTILGHVIDGDSARGVRLLELGSGRTYPQATAAGGHTAAPFASTPLLTLPLWASKPRESHILCTPLVRLALGGPQSSYAEQSVAFHQRSRI